MTAALRVGVICEGTTDHAVLRPLLEALTNGGTVVLLQPDSDRLEPRTGPGWQGVRAFLKAASAEIAASPLDILVVQIDADVRGEPEVEPHLTSEDGDHDLDPLCRHVKGWMTAGVPESAVIVLPRERTEAWLLAANSRKKNVESIPKPEAELPDPGSRGKRDKSVVGYRELVKPLVPKLSEPKELAAIPELERFVTKVRARVRRIAAEARASKETPRMNDHAREV